MSFTDSLEELRAHSLLHPATADELNDSPYFSQTEIDNLTVKINELQEQLESEHLRIEPELQKALNEFKEHALQHLNLISEYQKSKANRTEFAAQDLAKNLATIFELDFMNPSDPDGQQALTNQLLDLQNQTQIANYNLRAVIMATTKQNAEQVPNLLDQAVRANPDNNALVHAKLIANKLTLTNDKQANYELLTSILDLLSKEAKSVSDSEKLSDKMLARETAYALLELAKHLDLNMQRDKKAILFDAHSLYPGSEIIKYHMAEFYIQLKKNDHAIALLQDLMKNGLQSENKPKYIARILKIEQQEAEAYVEKLSGSLNRILKQCSELNDKIQSYKPEEQAAINAVKEYAEQMSEKLGIPLPKAANEDWRTTIRQHSKKLIFAAVTTTATAYFSTVGQEYARSYVFGAS